jgi:cell division protease FtsH
MPLLSRWHRGRRAVRQHWLRLRGWIGEHRIWASLLGVMGVLVLSLSAIAAIHGLRNRALERQAEQGVALTAAGVEVAIQRHTLAQVDWFNLKADTFGARSIYRLTFQDGSFGWIESKWLPDTTSKHLSATAVTDSVRFRMAGTSLEENPALGALGTLGLLAVFGLVLVAVQQALMGHGGMRFIAEGLNPDIRFDSIVGYPEVKREMQEVVEQLQHAQRFMAHGLKPPRGLLLVGPPGVGKTMFAKALANEAGLPFFSVTGADFPDTWVGVGARRVKQLFAQARKAKRAIVFIDEMDAIGSRDRMGHDTERMSVINRLLAELDGINEAGEILVVGTTNHAHLIDPALRRAGRLGKEIHIGLPDWTTRHALLSRLIGPLTEDSDLDVEALTARTTGCSGADIQDLANNAKKLAVREHTAGPLRVLQGHFHRAHETTLLGVSENRPTAGELQRVAFHELGHAIVGHAHCPSRVMDKITVHGRGQALGFTLHRPIDERKLQTEADLKGALAMLMGGRVAEQVFLGDASDGAAGDLAEANRLVRRMVLELGMGPTLGLVGLQPDQALGPAPVRSAWADMGTLLRQAEATARTTIEAHRTWMETQCAVLMREGTLDALQALPLRPVT